MKCLQPPSSAVLGPSSVLHSALDGPAVEVGDLDARRRNNREIAVGEEKHVARLTEDGAHAGSDEILVVAQANDRRRTVARSYDFVGFVRDQGPTVVGTLDLAGNPRVQATNIDVGAYEQLHCSESGDNEVGSAMHGPDGLRRGIPSGRMSCRRLCHESRIVIRLQHRIAALLCLLRWTGYVEAQVERNFIDDIRRNTG